MSIKYSLIIPTVRQTTLLKRCVDTIRQHEKGTDYEIIVVDDGSEKNIQTWVEGFCNNNKFQVSLQSENKGFAHTVNVGLKMAQGEHLVLVNNDVEFIKPILHLIDKAFATLPKVGVLGAKLLFPPGDKVQHAGVVRIPHTRHGGAFIHTNKHVPRNNPAVNQSKYFPSVTGALYCIRRDAYEAIGDWNEEYFLSCEDTEYSLRSWQKGWHVYYDHNIEAIHHEGKTRGANDFQKKKESIKWFQRERETIPKFHADLAKYDLDQIDKTLRELNSGSSTKRKVQNILTPMAVSKTRVVTNDLPEPVNTAPKKLEVGCGEYGQPGYIHLDIRPLKGVDVVCDFSKDRLPYQNNEIDDLLSNHSIEHVSFRKIPHVVAEWFRVLKPGGRLFFRTPDLEFIARTYLEGKLTPEAPQDEKYILDSFNTKMTPSWWANIKLFAGQDYDSNFHYFCFDFAMAKATLEHFGFENVTRLDIVPKFSPGELQVEAFKPGASTRQAEVSKPLTKVLVKRKGAVGDVILTTPIVRRLREIHGQEAIIYFATNCGSVYQNNPYVDSVLPGNTLQDGYTHFIDLDTAYERAPEQHIVEAYTKTAFAEDGWEYDKKTDLFPTENEKDFVHGKLAQFNLASDEMLQKCVVLHPAVTWKNRTFPKQFWQRAADKMIENGRKILIIGKGNDHKITGDAVYDMQGVFTIQQLAFLIRLCETFVSNDSGMLHVAGTTNTKIVGLFTCAKGEYRVPFRNGEYGHNCLIMKPQVDCYGCLHKEKPPVFFTDCRRGDYKCLTEITPSQVAEAVG